MMIDQYALEPPALSLGDLAWGAGDLLRRGLGWLGVGWPTCPPSPQIRRKMTDSLFPGETPNPLPSSTIPISLSRIGALPTGPPP